MSFMKRLFGFVRYNYAKSTKSKQKEQNKTLIINENLKFKGKDFDMYFIPSHPKILAKSPSSYEIDSNSSVVELVFVEKFNNPQLLERWKESKKIELTFKQLGVILDLNLGSHQTLKIGQNKINAKMTTFNELLDISDQKQVQFNSQLRSGEKIKQTYISAYLPYTQFQFFRSILKQSLYDLSGLRFMFQSRKKQQTQLIKKDLQQIISKSQQINQFYKN